MKILFLTSRFPYPTLGGDKIRALSILDHLARSHDLTLVAAYETDEDLAGQREMSARLERVIPVRISRLRSYLGALRGLFSRDPLQCHYYRTRELQRTVDEELETGHYDAVFVHLIRMADYVKYQTSVRKLLDLTDAISMNYERSKRFRRGLFRWINHIECSRVRRYESSVLSLFDHSFVVSDVDREYLQRLVPSSELEVLGMTIDTNFFRPNPGATNADQLVVLANLRSFPNEHGVLYFANEILPRITDRAPNVRLNIVGVNPRRVVRNLGRDPRITVTGFVDDVREHLWRATVAICPIWAGSGVQNKILQYMACGLPVVTTSVGQEGVDARAGEELLVADEPEEFAAHVLSLLESPELRSAMGQAGRRFIEKHYDRAQVFASLDRALSA